MNVGDTDPWSGDGVPVAPGLGEIVWETPADRSGELDPEPPEHRSVTRRLLLPTAAVATVGVVLVAVLAWPDGGSGDASEPVATASATPTTLSTLPPASTSEPTTTAEPVDAEPASDDVPNAPPLVQIPRDDLPPAVAASAVSTEVVVVTDEGELVSIGLPTGEVTERVDLGLSRSSQFGNEPGNLVTSPDAALYSIGNELVLVPTGGSPVAIDRDEFRGRDTTNPPAVFPFGWTTDVGGSNVFVVISFDSIGRQREWLVNDSGAVSPAPAQRSGSFARPIYSLGRRFIDDAGGAYRVDANGDSNRVSDGQILAISQTRLLLRECNANRVCTTVLRDYDGNEVRVVNLPPTFQPFFFAAALSPDGGAISFSDPTFSGERTIIDLDSGETLLFTEQAREVAQPAWAADSSGIFTFGADDGIRFLDRSTGDEYSFAADIGEIRAIATRVSSP